jgi:hypothetical protein
MRFRQKVFIAYASDAEAFAKSVSARLRSAGFRSALDTEFLSPGSSFDRALEDAIRSSSLFLFIVSSRSCEPDAYARTELHWAVTSARHILGVFAPSNDWPELEPPPEIAARTLVSPHGDRAANVVSEVRKILGRPTLIGQWAIIGLAAVVIVLAIPWILRPGPFIGNVYDATTNAPIPGVKLSFLGLGPECEPVITNQDGAFSFEKCKTARRSVDPHVILQLPDRDYPCGRRFPLNMPPRTTRITVDAKDPSCLVDISVGLPTVNPKVAKCVAAFRSAVSRAAASGLLVVIAEKHEEFQYSAVLARPPEKDTPQCHLLRNADPHRETALFKYLSSVSSSHSVATKEEIRKLGYTATEAERLHACLSVLRFPRLAITLDVVLTTRYYTVQHADPNDSKDQQLDKAVQAFKGTVQSALDPVEHGTECTFR